ncbi:hypothetical protein C1645_819517 [Glomus cerebriforme]|uniref:Uncharacterized protein n=1 Tax=Glomus cerebriforme TaxID=658196 RepID=A0A397T4Q4_9GLOM|nr:hypothetical protein C1645_819517 [Glomus cerebriforme]
MATKKRNISDSSQGERFDPRLLQIASNILTQKDILTRESKIRGIVTKSSLIRYSNKGEEYPDVCFSFCGDLRRVKFYEGIEKGSDSEGKLGRPLPGRAE